MPDFLLPDLGEGLTEAEIVGWLVAEGDTITVDQPVVEVETAKARVEVPVPFGGVVTARHGEVGQRLPVGAPLLSVGAPVGESVGESVGEPGGSGPVLIGYGTQTSSPNGRRRGRRNGRQHADPTTTPAPTTTRPDNGARPGRVTAVISPLVRKVARDHGIDLNIVTGTGPQGIIRRADLDAALAALVKPREQRPREEKSPDGDRRVRLSGVRRATADLVSRSRREIPEVTIWVDVDATELLATRAALNERDPAHPVSVLSLLARFTIAGLRRFPELNARLAGDDLILLSAIHLGFAAQTDNGLVVPVVRDAEKLSARELAAAVAGRVSAARDGSLPPADLAGGTFTVNNYGTFGVDGGTAIINHPEVAMLGMGRIVDRPWAVNGELAVRKVCELTLVFDHRVCDGGVAGGFLRFVADCVESPTATLGDL